MNNEKPDLISNPADLVAQGAALLDQARPGWFNEINIEELNMATGDKCILGQLYGTYFYGMDVLDICWGHNFGFNVHNRGSYTELQENWLKEIEKRRNAG